MTDTFTKRDSERAVSLMTDMNAGGYLRRVFDSHIDNWLVKALKNDPNIIEQIKNANSPPSGTRLPSLLSDAYGMISGGFFSFSVCRRDGEKGKSLAVTCLKPCVSRDTDIRFANDPAAVTDWSGATAFEFRADVSEYGGVPCGLGFAFEESDTDGEGNLTRERESWCLKIDAKVALLADGSDTWVDARTKYADFHWGNRVRLVLPAYFRGRVRVSLDNATLESYWGTNPNGRLDLRDVHQFQFSLDAPEQAVGKTAYFGSFGFVSDGFHECWNLADTVNDGYCGVLVPWYDEFPGKLLTGMALAYSAERSERVFDAGTALADALVSAQGEDGYTGIYDKNTRFITNWDVWGHYHSVYGLLRWYTSTGDGKYLAAAVRAADCVYGFFSGSGRPYADAGEPTMNLAISHAFACLFSVTKDVKYLAAAESIVAREWETAGGNWMNDALAGKDYYESTLPRWEALHTVMTLGILFEATGKTEYFTSLENIWHSIRRTDVHNTGGFSTDEQACGSPYKDGAIESCCTIAWNALGCEYLQLSHDSTAADELELSYLNAVLGALIDDGAKITYNTPMNGVLSPSQKDISFQYNAGSPDFNCCQANASRGVFEVADWAFLTSRTALYVNYYGECSAHTRTPSGQTVVLTQHTSYPVDGGIKITLGGLANEEEFVLNLRIPAWADSASVQINGDDVLRAEPGHYCPLRRTWKNGDTVTLVLGFGFRFKAGECEKDGLTSVYYGPALLAAEGEYTSALSKDAIIGSRVCPGDGIVCLYADVTTSDVSTSGGTVRLRSFGGFETGERYTTWLRVKT